jgi:predicted RNase H-like HicB family nuclease
MAHYLAVLVPLAGGGWRAHFPDFPGCRAEGQTVETAIDASGAAATAQARLLQERGIPLPNPRTYANVRQADNEWAAERGIDWSNAVIILVRLSARD